MEQDTVWSNCKDVVNTAFVEDLLSIDKKYELPTKESEQLSGKTGKYTLGIGI